MKNNLSLKTMKKRAEYLKKCETDRYPFVRVQDMILSLMGSKKPKFRTLPRSIYFLYRAPGMITEFAKIPKAEPVFHEDPKGYIFNDNWVIRKRVNDDN